MAFKITAVADSALAGLKTAGGAVSSLAERVTGGLGPAVSGLKGVFGGLPGILMASVGAAPDIIRGQIEKIRELAAQGLKAQTLGVKSEDFMGMGKLAEKFSIDADVMEKALYHLGTVTKVPLGIDVDKWASADKMARFKMVADQIKDMPDANDKSAASAEAFGEKVGRKMVPALAQGSKGIEDFIAKQKEMGTALGGADMARVMQAKEALPKLAGVFEGFKTRMTVAFAPLITVFANVFEKFMPAIQKVVSFAADIYTNYLQGMATLWEMVFEWVGELLKELGELVAKWDLFEGSVPSMASVFDSTFRFIGKAVAYVFDTIKAGFGVVIEKTGMMASSLAAAAEKLGMTKTAANLKRIGGDMIVLGLEWRKGWGDSADKVDEFFDKIKARNAQMGKDAEQTTQQIISNYSAAAAAIQGGREDVSIRARFMTEGLMPADRFGRAVKPLIDEAKERKRQLDRVIDLLRSGPWQERMEAI